MDTSVKTISKMFKYKPIPTYIGLRGRIPVKHRDVFVGIELEIENYVGDYLPNTVNLVQDGSLKLNGAELVTIPIQLQYLEVELDRLLCTHKHKFLLSTRCSTHVHMNVRDMTPEEIGNLLLLYMIFEKSLYNLCKNDRWNNNFCVPLYMAHNMVKQWFKYENYSTNWSWNKYTGLNISPIWGGESTKIGTVEFRQLHGSVDTEEIINWCNLITALKRAAQKIPREEIMAHIRIMKTTSGYWWLAKEVFGSWAKKLTNQSTFAEDVEDCITNLKVIMYKAPEVQKKAIKINYSDDIFSPPSGFFINSTPIPVDISF